MADAPLVENATDQEQVTRARHKTKDARLHRTGLVAHQLSTLEGREFVWEELQRRGIHDRVTAPGTDLVAIGVFLGQREAGLTLLTELMQDHPDAYLLMQREALQRAKREKDEREAAKLARKDKHDGD